LAPEKFDILGRSLKAFSSANFKLQFESGQFQNEVKGQKEFMGIHITKLSNSI